MTGNSVPQQANAALLVTNFQYLDVVFSRHVCYGKTYIKIGTIQRGLAWPLMKNDTKNRGVFYFFSNIKWQCHSTLAILPIYTVAGGSVFCWLKQGKTCCMYLALQRGKRGKEQMIESSVLPQAKFDFLLKNF